MLKTLYFPVLLIGAVCSSITALLMYLFEIQHYDLMAVSVCLQIFTIFVLVAIMLKIELELE